MMKKFNIKNLIVIIYVCFFATICFAAAPTPKNIIVMIGDGMGFEQVEAGLLYSGKKATYKKFPVKLEMTTYSHGQSYDSDATKKDANYVTLWATDSAAAATAMAAGVKTHNGTIGVDINKKPLQNILEFAESKGKSTGIITTVQFYHATPAGFVAHNESRNNYLEIANEMIDQSPLEVIIGAGHPLYDDNGKERTGGKFKDILGRLKDGLAGGDCDGDGIEDKWNFIDSREDFLTAAHGDTSKRFFGLARVASTLQQSRDGNKDAMPFEVALNKNVPSLAEMTLAGLGVLDNDPDGFVLMIEGGAIDWAGHANQSGRLIEEVLDFNKAVEAVVQWCKENKSLNDTLIIVTADHECGFLKTEKKNGKPVLSWGSKGHTNSPVPFYAMGPGAKKFKKIAVKDGLYSRGRIDNTDIAKTIFGILDATK